MKNILLVDDDPDMLTLYEKFLTLEGFKVTAARGGEETLRIAAEAKPDLILLDVMMPKMNGIEALEALKSQPSTKDIPVAMFSNFTDEKYTTAALKKGAVAYLAKSDYDPEELAALVKNLASRKPSQT